MPGTAYSAAAHWRGDFDETGFQHWVEALREQVTSRPLSLGLVFIAPPFFSRAAQILEIVQVHGRVPVVAGCSGHSLIAMAEEVEEDAGISVALYSLPGAQITGFHFEQSQVEEARGAGYWRLETGVKPETSNGWLAFVDPFSLDIEAWLKTWNEAYGPRPVFGGLASGSPQARSTQVYLDGKVYEEGGVALSVGGAVRLAGVTSQGCTPIGDTWTLTSVEQNVINTIGNHLAILRARKSSSNV